MEKSAIAEAERRKIRWQDLLALLLVLLLALAGQALLLLARVLWPAALLCFTAAVLLFILLLSRWPDAALLPRRSDSLFSSYYPAVRARAARVILAAGAILLAAIAYMRFAGNALLPGLWPWLGAIAFFLLAFARLPANDRAARRAALAAWWRSFSRRDLVLLLLIMALATFFRLYRLDTVPAEMTSDHAEKLLDVQDVLDGARPIFFPRNTGREALQFYLTAALVHFTPLEAGHLALKTGMVIFGLLALPFTYLLGRELFGSATGLLAACFLAISHWHVAITRVGLRFPFTAAFAAPALFFLFRAFRTDRRNDWLVCALFTGIGLHTYTAMRAVPLLLGVLVLLQWLLDLRSRRKVAQPLATKRAGLSFVQNALLAIFFALLLALPLLRFAVDEPEAFWYRAVSRSTNKATPLAQQALTFLDNTKNALLMFNYRGDVVPMNTIPDSPVLDPVAAALLVLGLAFLLWRLLRYRDRRALYLLVSLWFLLLPSILSLAFPGENPSVVRTGGAVPVTLIIVALPLALILGHFRALPPPGRRVAPLILLGLLLGPAIAYNYHWYFVRYDEHIRRSLWNATEMGEAVRAFVAAGGDIDNAYHVAYPHWVDTRNIGINAGAVRWHNALSDPSVLPAHRAGTRPRLYLLFPEDQSMRLELARAFPEGQEELVDSPWEGKDFIVFYVP